MTDVVALPGRRGLSVSDEVLHRDPSTQQEPHPDVVRAWTTVEHRCAAASVAR
ncbi:MULTISPECIES: hypothetical protein [unclassified Amycolatopsis]|uniref:hypothetical protein n=1 Tax=unclassified Amycolatopsis TaxID=2618356 RepID=UPI001C697C6E|nr:hypothetical protein [Amycolatopsis sp. DSM 110486]QYN21186.1 hypothetical protein K1T34_00985 [Amycolatopsis sp. DSM 110486]